MEKYFKHKLPTNDIIVREDVDSGSDFIQNTYGKYYPLVRLNDFVFSNAQIEYFNLNFGINQFLPSVELIIDDIDGNFKDNNWVKNGDVATIFVGNAKDEYHEPIKNNYFITHSENNGTYFLKAILDVKQLYYVPNRVFVNKTSFEVFKFIADECGLGFVSNITQTNDRMNWIQYQNNMDFLFFVSDRSYINDDTKIVIFVDQFANLNVIDLNKALTQKTTTTFLTNDDGEKLEKDSIFQITNSSVGKTEPRFAFLQSYTPINDIGDYFAKNSRTLKVNKLKYDTMSSNTNVIDSQKETLQFVTSFTSIYNENTFVEYEYAKQLNRQFNNHLFKTQKISGSMGSFYPQIFLFQTVYCELYNTMKKDIVDSQERTTNTINFDEKIEQDNKSFTEEKLNENFTSDYVILNINYSFSYDDKNINMINQNITFLQTK